MFNRKGIPKSRLQFLRGVPIFAGIPDKTLARIDGLLTESSLSAGAVLTKQGSVSAEAFIIAEGTAEVRIDDNVIGEAGAGELVGELGILDHKPRTATVTARTPMTVLVLNPRELATLMHEESLTERFRANIDRHHQGPQP